MRKRGQGSEILEVISYSGYRADEHPLWIKWEGGVYKVLDWKKRGYFLENGEIVEKFWVKTEDESEWELALKRDGTWILLWRRNF